MGFRIALTQSLAIEEGGDKAREGNLGRQGDDDCFKEVSKINDPVWGEWRRHTRENGSKIRSDNAAIYRDKDGHEKISRLLFRINASKTVFTKII